MNHLRSLRRVCRAGAVGELVAIASLLLLAVACTAEVAQQPTAGAAISTPSGTAQPPPAPASTPLATSAPAPLKMLKANPELGPVGTSFTLSGESLPSGKSVEFQWATWDGSYKTKASAETIEYFERQFTPKRVPLGNATVDGGGKAAGTLTVPEDYGEVHDVYAVVDGQDVAKGGFRLLRTASITPLQGPVGSLITVTVKGIDWKPFTSTMGLRWDNKYTGFVSAVTTRGTAVFRLRAAGTAGKHVIQLTGGSPGTPYLNIPQSPNAYMPQDFLWEFTVTGDARAASLVDRPDETRVLTDGIPKTTMSSGRGALAASARTEPASGAVLSSATLYAGGLPPGAGLDLFWVTAKGNRVSPSGWNLVDKPLAKATTSSNGTLETKFQIPDDLGGWHALKLVQGEKVVAEASYYVERSLVQVAPERVKVGEHFTVQIKGVGWTELDNGVAVTYDNAYVGYACGFNSNGDVTLDMVATGASGTHLIDLYPMVYQGHGQPPWSYQLPHLNALEDHPGLALGYKLPIFRLTVEVVE